MANFVAASLATALALPVQVVRGLADLPGAMDRNMRQTNDLMRQSGEQLRLMHAQAEAMLAQMQEMHAVAEKLHLGSDPLAQSARLAREQLTATHAELVRMNEQLGRLIRLAEPIERAQRRGERFGSFFRRAQREEARRAEGEATVTES
jgi:hypothetical protein